jgi:hypothetical protein
MVDSPQAVKAFAKQGIKSSENFDPFNKPIAGEGLIDPVGGRPYEQPPRRVNPDDVLEDVLEKLEDEDRQDKILDLVFAGVPVETIVQTFALEGVTRGEFTPDVAEIVKPTLALVIMDLAREKDIPVTMFNEDAENAGSVDEAETLDIMRNARPELFEAITGSEVEEGMDMEDKEDDVGSFINMGDK